MMNGAHTQYNLKRICFNREARSLFVNGKYHCTEVDQFKESVLVAQGITIMEVTRKSQREAMGRIGGGAA